MRNRYEIIVPLAAAFLSALASADPLVYVVNLAQQFGTVDLTTGAFSSIGPGLADGAGGLVPGPGGSLLTLSVTGDLVTVNPATGAPSVVGSTGLGGNANSLGELGSTLYMRPISTTIFTWSTQRADWPHSLEPRVSLRFRLIPLQPTPKDPRISLTRVSPVEREALRDL